MSLSLDLNGRSSRPSFIKFIGKIVDYVSVKEDDGRPRLVEGFRFMKKQVPNSDVEGKRLLLFPVDMCITDKYNVVHKIILYFTADNLYLIGYDSGTDRFQFEGVNVMEDANRTLHFDGTYPGLRAAGGRGPEGVPVGKMTLSQAVLTLSGRRGGGEASDEEKARALLSLIIHISEACRFYTIENHVVANYEVPGNVMLTYDLTDLINEWKALSKVVREYSTGGITAIASTSYLTAEQALARATGNVRLLLNVGDWE